MNNGDSPAFPFPAPIQAGVPIAFDEVQGLTKREWFAGMAMQGILANPQIIEGMGDAERKFEDGARFSFRWADAMLKEGE